MGDGTGAYDWSPAQLHEWRCWADRETDTVKANMIHALLDAYENHGTCRPAEEWEELEKNLEDCEKEKDAIEAEKVALEERLADLSDGVPRNQVTDLFMELDHAFGVLDRARTEYLKIKDAIQQAPKPPEPDSVPATKGRRGPKKARGAP